MPYIGKQPTPVPLTAGDLDDNIITQAKMADDAIALAELKAGTDGELISWDASGNPVAIGAGSSGHFLKSQGAGSQPVFAAAGGGMWTEIENQSLTTGETDVDYIDFETLSTDYKDFQVVCTNYLSDTDSMHFGMQLYRTAATAYDTANVYASRGFDSEASGRDKYSGTATTTTTIIFVCANQGSEANVESGNTIATIFDVHSTTIPVQVLYATSFWVDNARMVHGLGAGTCSDAGAVSKIRLMYASNKISNGDFTLYGRKITT